MDLSDIHWEPPKEFDSRFHYYPEEMNLTELLSTDERRQTTEEDEVAKTGLYGMNESCDTPATHWKLRKELRQGCSYTLGRHRRGV